MQTGLSPLFRHSAPCPQGFGLHGFLISALTAYGWMALQNYKTHVNIPNYLLQASTVSLIFIDIFIAFLLWRRYRDDSTSDGRILSALGKWISSIASIAFANCFVIVTLTFSIYSTRTVPKTNKKTELSVL